MTKEEKVFTRKQVLEMLTDLQQELIGSGLRDSWETAVVSSIKFLDQYVEANRL